MKEPTKPTIEAYSIMFGIPDITGNIYTKESINLESYENMKERGIILEYVVDEKGVKITKYK